MTVNGLLVWPTPSTNVCSNMVIPSLMYFYVASRLLLPSGASPQQHLHRHQGDLVSSVRNDLANSGQWPADMHLEGVGGVEKHTLTC
jgi:hypothetical protein